MQSKLLLLALHSFPLCLKPFKSNQSTQLYCFCDYFIWFSDVPMAFGSAFRIEGCNRPVLDPLGQHVFDEVSSHACIVVHLIELSRTVNSPFASTKQARTKFYSSTENRPQLS